MFKFPLLIVYAAIAINITAFTVLLQMDWLIFNSPIAKIVAWVATATAWAVAFRNRNKYYEIKLK